MKTKAVPSRCVAPYVDLRYKGFKMEFALKISSKGLQVLSLFLSDVRQERSGAEISKQLKIGSGTLYPLLARFEACGWLESEWEDIDASEVGRPRRRNYRLTGLGQHAAMDELSKLSVPNSGGRQPVKV
ncbi:MAG: PadR family transcriptional regulator [Hyphomicrobiaceae bacterium]|nr:PadR family transcriptional regulator [Hyphomicrobiaceae bacterium]